MNITLLTGAPAQEWINDPSNIEAWRRLYKAVGSRQTYLSPEFCEIWYRHYAHKYETILLIAADANGVLCALMPLARNNKSLTGAGSAQGEYQGWLAPDDLSDAFFNDALRALGKQFPGENLCLKYVLPGTGAETLSRLSSQDSKAKLVRHDRPIIAADLASVQKSLRKKGNRSKLNRLKKAGKLELVRVSSEAEFDRFMDQVFAAYDLRQGAKNNSCPFYQDSQKKAFHKAWFLADPNNVYISVLTLDDRPIASFFGVVIEKTLANAIVSYEPDVACQSPSKLQIYMLAEELAEAGFSSIDLTPGGDTWKQRFSVQNEQALEFTYWADSSALRRREWTDTARKFVKSLAAAFGVTPARARSALTALQTYSLESLKKRLIERTEHRLYRLKISQIVASTCRSREQLAINSTSDLVALASSENNGSRKQFLTVCFERLAHGYKSYTARQDNRLTFCGWVAHDQKSFFLDEIGREYEFPKPGAILYGFSYPAGDQTRHSVKEAIEKMLNDIRLQDQPPDWVYIFVDGNDNLFRQIVEDIGFQNHESIIKKNFLFNESCKVETMIQGLFDKDHYPNNNAAI